MVSYAILDEEIMSSEWCGVRSLLVRYKSRNPVLTLPTRGMRKMNIAGVQVHIDESNFTINNGMKTWTIARVPFPSSGVLTQTDGLRILHQIDQDFRDIVTTIDEALLMLDNEQHPPGSCD